MTRHSDTAAEARKKNSFLKKQNAKFGAKMQPLPESDWPSFSPDGLFAVWRSRDFLCQVFKEKNGIHRLSICQTKVDKTGNWKDGISWDDLQRIKSECGYGELDAIEIYPSEDRVVNVANMRHLWVFPKPLPFGWGLK